MKDLIRFLKVDTAFEPDFSRKHLNSSSAEIPGTLYRTLRKYNLWHPLRKLAPDSFRPHFRKLAFGKYKPIKMNGEDRGFLCDYYKDDVLKLSSFLGRDLSSWLE